MQVGQLSSEQIVQGFGLPAAIVIIVLAGVVIFLYRDGKSLQKRFDDMQEQRIQDARDTRDKLSAPLEKIASQSDKIYELLLNRRGQ